MDSNALFPVRLASDEGSLAARKSKGDAHEREAARVKLVRVSTLSCEESVLELLLRWWCCEERESAAAMASMRLHKWSRIGTSERRMTL